MKTLNIDALAKANRTLTLKGITYDVPEMSVENFIETSRAQEALGENPTIAQQIEEGVALIRRFVPDVPEAVLRKLPLESLTTIINFVRGDLDDEGQDEVEDTVEGK